MKEKIHIYYDKEGDVLEIDIGKPTAGYCKNLGNSIFEKIDEKTGISKGYTILNFKKKLEKSIDISLPIKLSA